MPTNRVHVRYNETYDLSTKADSLGLIAVHTPSTLALKKKFEGLFKQFKYIKFNSVSLRCACASLMPLDPLQVGLEAGQVAPQDMFNPILYTAVSNEAMGNILDRIHSFNTLNADPEASTTAGPSLNWNDGFNVSNQNPFSVYYALLSGERFKTAMPQQGFEMHNVVPLAHEIVTNVAPTGTMRIDGGSASESVGSLQGTYFGHRIAEEDVGTSVQPPGSVLKVPIQTYSAGVRPLPRIPTMVAIGSNLFAINEPTPVYCISAILPPAKLQRLFFRMVISWSITFEEFRSLDETMGFTDLAGVGDTFYKSDYDSQSASMTSLSDTLDVGEMDATLVTTSVS